jgi:hypothetical protein
MGNAAGVVEIVKAGAGSGRYGAVALGGHLPVSSLQFCSSRAMVSGPSLSVAAPVPSEELHD